MVQQRCILQIISLSIGSKSTAPTPMFNRFSDASEMRIMLIQTLSNFAIQIQPNLTLPLRKRLERGLKNAFETVSI